MSWPVPQPGLVVRYSYLWEREAREGREEGVKDRPCAIVLVVLREDESQVVRVLPVTHSPPDDPLDALEIPQPVKQRLGLDTGRSWVVLSEANDFIWPGPDLRPAVSGDPSSVAYGFLPPGFFRVLRERLIARRKVRLMQAVARSE
ncbi:hypothetical protein [Rhodovulum sp. PH10]|uniref:hypothetical protein n=1 Tax=Rhodovulum sp. PH10 TaxID=1187851 RepID=UPI00058F9DAB|nr:hypothetical protein [Rhodovulum sp. PH10]